MNSNLGSAEIIPVIQPKAKAAGSSSDLDKLQYLRQDKPEVCYSGSGKSGNTHGKQPGVSGELQGPWRVDSPCTARHVSPVPAEPVARVSLLHGSGANPRLIPGFIFFCGGRKMTFWRLRTGMETILEFLKSPMGLNDLLSTQLKGQSAASQQL